MGLHIDISPYKFNKASVERGTCSILKHYYGHTYRVYMSTRYIKYRVVVIGDKSNRLVHLFRIGGDSVLYIGSHAIKDESDQDNWFNNPVSFITASIPMGLFEMDDLEPFKNWSIDVPDLKNSSGSVVVKIGDIVPTGVNHTKIDTSKLFGFITEHCDDKFSYQIPGWLYSFSDYLKSTECLAIPTVD